MRLQRISYRNFKGIEKFDLEPAGADVIVNGANATGKTTLADGFLWLLFNKDSHNRADFQIKTLNEDGSVKHGLDHSVEAVLDLDGREVTLKKTYHELWPKKRGRAEATFTGHETKYWIDGVPSIKKEYDAFVAELCDERVFRLLTDPTYFNEHLKWQDRRELLFEVGGDVSDEDVIASDKALAKLPDILGNASLEAHKKKVAARRKAINADLKELPARIDEVKHNLPEEPELSVEKIQAEVEEQRQRWQELQQQIVRTEGGGRAADIQKRLTEIEVEEHDIGRKVREQAEARAGQLRQERNAAQERVDRLTRELSQHSAELKRVNDRIEQLTQEREQLRQEWHTIHERAFTADIDGTCPACGQPLPEAKIQAAHDRAEAQFNEQKAADLARVTEAGHTAKAEQERLEHQQSDLTTAIKETQERLNSEEQAVTEKQAALERAEKAKPDLTGNERYQALAKERRELMEELESFRDGDYHKRLQDLRQEASRVDERIEELQALLSDHERRREGQERIAELEARERELAEEYESLEQEDFLIQTFTRRKAEVMTERINSRFELARFKLFHEQMDGALDDTCETTFQGVPYSNLNGGARLNVGLDIINTLAGHYGFAPPVFIDNAESVTDILPTRGQAIKLVVSARDKKLRVEEAQQEVAA